MEKKCLRKGFCGSFMGVCMVVFLLLCTVLFAASQCIAQQSDQTTGVTSDKIKIGKVVAEGSTSELPENKKEYFKNYYI